MNARLLAELHRERARIDIEIAEAFEADEAATPEEKSKPRLRARPRARAFPPPLNKPTEIDMARADRELRRRGIQR